MIRSIWFDSAGVIVHPVEARFNALLIEKHALDRSRVSVEQQKLDKLSSDGKISGEEYVQKVFLGKVSFEEALLLQRSLAKFMPGTLQIIKGLKHQKYKLVLTNNEAKEFDIIRDQVLGFFQYFDYCCSSWILGKSKPDLEYFCEVLRRINMRPEECLFIDDNENNVAAARSLGIDSILFIDAEQLKQELRKRGITT